MFQKNVSHELKNVVLGFLSLVDNDVGVKTVTVVQGQRRKTITQLETGKEEYREREKKTHHIILWNIICYTSTITGEGLYH